MPRCWRRRCWRRPMRRWRGGWPTGAPGRLPRCPRSPSETLLVALAPGSTIGILGGGQLGRMMALAAARIGYKCHIFDPHEAPCAAEVSAHFTRAEFDDEGALRHFGDQCDVITYEFENLPVEALHVLGKKLR